MDNNNIEVRTILEGQIHERLHFSLDVEGKEYQGHYHDGEIQWLNPHPQNAIGDGQLESIESDIHNHIQNNYLQ